ncbi:uncharacterized protein I303_105421 [Kwoniella dejecticola CBS 10117]|uniref:Uncharacterized protein n=1 Tax=Kwoniella dejecticola CBS 10117 TaxID=1296121 RepID=A0AAJ8KS51_9TREE
MVDQQQGSDDFYTDQLSFPPFLAVPSFLRLKSCDEWDDQGVWIPTSRPSGNTDSLSAYLTNSCPRSAQIVINHADISSASDIVTPHDNRGNRLLTVGDPFAGVDVSFDVGQAIHRAKKRYREHKRKDAAGRQTERLEEKDCWKIGNDPAWEEPEGTSRGDYDESIPPFKRLLTAASDFEFSRHAGLTSARDRRLFQLFRYNLGLRTHFPGKHWPGSGPYGVEYVGPKRSATAGHGDTVVDDISSPLGVAGSGQQDELTGARNFEPAHKFAVIASAFLSYCTHYNVLCESELRGPIERAAEIARTAPQALLDAKLLEDSISLGTGWNRASWTLFGGSWGGAERGGLERESISWGENNASEVARNERSSSDDGGWVVDPTDDPRPQPLNVDEVRPQLAHMLQPLDVESISLVGYIPYSRRRITAILPPTNTFCGGPSFAMKCYRLVTVPAPWTPNEKWRNRYPTLHHDAQSDSEESSGPIDGDISSMPLDLEVPTVEEPPELAVWLDSKIFDEDPDIAERLIGVGLRGRWGLMGRKDGSEEDLSQWWTFKAKDYVLPAFWSNPVTTHVAK